MSKYNLTGKTVLITGASGGIGSVGARMLTDEGARVVLVDLSEEAVSALGKQLPSGSALPFAADVTDRDQMEAAVDAAMEKFGRLDVVWANAGIANNPPVTLSTAELDSYEKVIEVDVLGVIRTIRPALPQVIQNKGQVVVTGSGYSFLNSVLNSSYGASKAALEMLGRALRLELAPYGASASVLYPGWTKTPITDSTQEDPLVSQLYQHVFRGPLGKLSAPEVVAEGLVAGLKKRSPRIFAPRPWALYSVLRGLLNPVTETVLSRDPKFLSLIRQVEASRQSATE